MAELIGSVSEMLSAAVVAGDEITRRAMRRAAAVERTSRQKLEDASEQAERSAEEILRYWSRKADELLDEARQSADRMLADARTRRRMLADLSRRRATLDAEIQSCRLELEHVQEACAAISELATGRLSSSDTANAPSGVRLQEPVTGSTPTQRSLARLNRALDALLTEPHPATDSIAASVGSTQGRRTNDEAGPTRLVAARPVVQLRERAGSARADKPSRVSASRKRVTAALRAAQGRQAVTTDSSQMATQATDSQCQAGPAEGRRVLVAVRPDPTPPTHRSIRDLSETPRPVTTILFLCTGNLCRSPVAEALLRQRLEAIGVPARVSSAGLRSSGRRADTSSLEVLRRRGIDLRPHRSRRVTPELLMGAELVLGMESDHVAAAARIAPKVCPRTFTLTELVRLGELIGGRAPTEPLDQWVARAHTRRGRDELSLWSSLDAVWDPRGHSLPAFEAMAAELEALLDRLVAVVWAGEKATLSASGDVR